MISSVVLFVFSVLVEYSYPMHLWYYSTPGGCSYQITGYSQCVAACKSAVIKLLKFISLPTLSNMSYVFSSQCLSYILDDFCWLNIHHWGHFYTLNTRLSRTNHSKVCRNALKVGNYWPFESLICAEFLDTL